MCEENVGIVEVQLSEGMDVALRKALQVCRRSLHLCNSDDMRERIVMNK